MKKVLIISVFIVFVITAVIFLSVSDKEYKDILNQYDVIVMIKKNNKFVNDFELCGIVQGIQFMKERELKIQRKEKFSQDEQFIFFCKSSIYEKEIHIDNPNSEEIRCIKIENGLIEWNGTNININKLKRIALQRMKVATKNKTYTIDYVLNQYPGSPVQIYDYYRGEYDSKKGYFMDLAPSDSIAVPRYFITNSKEVYVLPGS